MENTSINILKSLMLKVVSEFTQTTVDNYSVEVRLNSSYIIIDVAKSHIEFTFSYNFSDDIKPEKHLEIFTTMFDKFKDFITDL